jgi:uncharacterized membrane protein
MQQKKHGAAQFWLRRIERKSGQHQDMSISAIIGGVLQGGVIASSTIIVLGVILLLISPGGISATNLIHFPHTLGQVWTGLLAFQPQAIITLGLMVLIATPVLRVAISILAFRVEHDRLYVIITLIVLLILITSFMLGKGGA